MAQCVGGEPCRLARPCHTMALCHRNVQQLAVKAKAGVRCPAICRLLHGKPKMAGQALPLQEWGEKTVVLQVESGEDLLQLQQAAEQLQLPSYLVRMDIEFERGF